MAAFKHLDLEALPEGWEAKHFGELVDYALGRTPPRNDASYWKKGTYPWVSISDMEPYGTVMETAECVTERAFNRVFRGQLVPEGSLLMSFKLTIGRVSRLGIPALHNEAIISFLPQGQKVDDNYLAFYLSQINYSDYQDKAIKGHTLNKGKIDSLEIALPPLREQRRISGVLGTVQKAIEQQERLILTTTELKQALMQKLFTEGLRGEAQKETENGPVPESWEVVRLEEIAKIERGKFAHRPRNDPRFYDGLYPFIQTGDVSNCDGYVRSHTQSLNDLGLSVSKLFPAGTILITIAANIGFTGILSYAAAAPDSLIGITVGERVTNEYLNYYLTTQQPKMDLLAPRGTQKNINIEFLKPWPVLLPSLAEQRAIVEALDSVHGKTKQHTLKRDALQDLFRTLLHELMTGKVRVGEHQFT